MQTGTWLKSVRTQEIEEGVDHYALACNPYMLTLHTRDLFQRLIGSANRALARVPLPMEDDRRQRLTWEAGRETYIRELRDCAAALASALNAVGCTDAELSDAAPTMAEPTTQQAARQCHVCTAEITDPTRLSRTAAQAVILCGSEDCEELYDETETVQFTVLSSTRGEPQQQDS